MKKGILVADSGSTKTDWLLVRADGSQTELHTSGINPARDARDIIYNVLCHELLTQLPLYSTQNNGGNDSTHGGDSEELAIYFYGAGCIEPFSQTVKNVLNELFPGCHTEVESDLLGAARALCGHDAGIACILGTGSNSCLYDGNNIVMHTPPLGYILGDEGSGSYLGKTLLNGLFKGLLPQELKDAFCNKFSLSMPDIIERVYRKPAANAFLASLVPFIVEQRNSPAIHDLLIQSFRLFLMHNIAVYGHKEMPVNCVGGIAHQFESELKEAAAIEGMQIGRILRRPIDAMIQFHLK